MRDLAWRRSHSPTRGRRVSVLQRFGPGLVPADLLGRFAPEPLGVGHRGREVGLVLAATTCRRQRSAAPAPESAPRAGGHVRPAGRAGSPGWRGPGQGPPESPGAGDFATLQPGRLHRRQLGPPPPRRLCCPRSQSALLRRQPGLSRLPEGGGQGAGGGGSSRGEPGALEFGRHTRAAGKSRPGAAGEATGWSGGWGGGG